MVVFDATFLIPLFDDKAPEPIAGARRRLNHLVAELQNAHERILIPTPALSEYMVHAEAAGVKYLAIMSKSAVFKVVDFDTRAAVEAAEITREAKERGDKKGGGTEPWGKIKFDRQIVAIARVNNSSRIYSNDGGFKNIVGTKGPQVLSFADLPDPPQDAQINWVAEMEEEDKS
jgi:predicted nucleic acid-binding protein